MELNVILPFHARTIQMFVMKMLNVLELKDLAHVNLQGKKNNKMNSAANVEMDILEMDIRVMVISHFYWDLQIDFTLSKTQ